MAASSRSLDLGDRSFAKVLERRVFGPGDVIFAEGSPAREMFLVMRGEVDISAAGTLGKRVPLTTVRAGQMFGELALFGQSRRTATAVTSTGCELTVVSHETLKQKLEKADPLLRFLIAYLGDRVIELSHRIQSGP